MRGPLGCARSLILLFAIATTQCAGDGPDMAALRRGFAAPPPEYRPMPMLSYDYSSTAEFPKELKKAGWGGANVQFPSQNRERYLRDPGDWKQFETAVKAVRESGLQMWIYDERGYPSGKAGGQVLEGHPETRGPGAVLREASRKNTAKQ